LTSENLRLLLRNRIAKSFPHDIGKRSFDVKKKKKSAYNHPIPGESKTTTSRMR